MALFVNRVIVVDYSPKFAEYFVDDGFEFFNTVRANLRDAVDDDDTFEAVGFFWALL